MSVENEEVDTQTQELETEARNMGWQPKEEFSGDDSQWVTAEDFVERGRAVMPLLLKNNKRLHQELLRRDEKIGTLTNRLDAATSAIDKLERHYTEANKRAVDNAKRQLREDLKQARSDNDVDAEFVIQDKLTALNAVVEEPVKPAPIPADAPQLSPEFRTWNADNDWFGTDLKRTKEVLRIAEDLRDEGTELSGVEFMAECVKILDAREKPAAGKPPASKVESNSRSPRSTSNGKGFSDLPAEAKQACREDAEDLVGAGKRYKTVAEWETAYAKIYFSE